MTDTSACSSISTQESKESMNNKNELNSIMTDTSACSSISTQESKESVTNRDDLNSIMSDISACSSPENLELFKKLEINFHKNYSIVSVDNPLGDRKKIYDSVMPSLTIKSDESKTILYDFVSNVNSIIYDNLVEYAKENKVTLAQLVNYLTETDEFRSRILDVIEEHMFRRLKIERNYTTEENPIIFIRLLKNGFINLAMYMSNIIDVCKDHPLLNKEDKEESDKDKKKRIRNENISEKEFTLGVLVAENYNQPKIRKYFVKKGGIEYNKLNQYSYYSYKKTVIIAAIECNSLDIIHKMLSSHCHTNLLVNSVFAYAAFLGHLEALKIIINYTPSDFRRAMECAIQKRFLHIVEFLLQNHDIDQNIPVSRFLRIPRLVQTFREHYIVEATNRNFTEGLEMITNWKKTETMNSSEH